MSALQTVKLWAVNHLGLAKDALHIYVALGLFLGCAALFKWRLASWKPLAVAMAAAVCGEIWDIRDRVVGSIPQRWDANLHDIWNTVFWPLVIWALARWTRVLKR